METDQIHPALQSLQHPYQGISMSLGVIETGEHCVLETHSALPAEIILLYKVDNILKRPCTLHRHHTETFRTERIVKTDSQMALTLIEVSLQIREHTNCRKRYPLRAPTESPIRCKYLDRTHNVFIIVQRLTHSHEHSVCQVVRLIHSNELRDDVGSRKLTVESLAACHAELAPHLASGL